MSMSMSMSSSTTDPTAATTDPNNSNNDAFLLWKCPICLDTLERPVLTTCCGQSFCDACLNAALVKIGACPMCREPLLTGAHSATRNRALEDILARLSASVRTKEHVSIDGADTDANEHDVLIEIDRGDSATTDRSSEHSARRSERDSEQRHSWQRSVSSVVTRVRDQLHWRRIRLGARSWCVTSVQWRQWRLWCRVHWSSLQCIFYVVLFFVFVSFLRVQEEEFAGHQQ